MFRIAKIGAAVAFVATALHACVEPSSVDASTCPGASVPFCSSADSTRGVLAPMALDAATRSAGALGNAATKPGLSMELDLLSSAIVAGDLEQARSALDRAHAALATARSQLPNQPGDAPDLDVIELALLQITRAIQ
jgi:hypothetical protein